MAVSRDPDAEILRRRLSVLARRHELTALSLAAGQVRRRQLTTLSTPVVVGLQVLLVCLLLLGIGMLIRAFGGA